MIKASTVILILALPAGSVAGPWRNYEVYDPRIEVGDIYNGSTGRLKYNHCATVAWYRDRWVALWNANTVPKEGAPSQPVVLATSRDFLNWSEPIEPFCSPEYCTNPVTLGTARQWQPNLVVYKDELWCFWSHNSDCYFSYLCEPDGKWTNQRIDVGEEAVIDGIRYQRLFPTQNPIVLSTGRVLAPLTIVGPRMELEREGVPAHRFTRKIDTVLYTDDGGKTWHLSPGATIPGKEWACWEPTVWETDNGLVRMLARNKDWWKGGATGTQMLTRSVSRDGGTTWTPHEFIPVETISSRAHVLPLGGGQFVMAMNDWRRGRFAADRHNGALFFNRGGGWDFVPGTRFSSRDPSVAYPQMVVKDNAVHIAYTRQGAPSSIRYSRVSPLPDPDHYYLFPRSNTPPSPVPVPEGRSLTFASEQRLETQWAKRDGQTDLSMGLWVKLQGNGVLLDMRDSGPCGILFHIRDGQLTTYLSTAEKNITSEFSVPTGEWCYLGLSIDNRAGQVTFLMNEHVDQKTFTSPAPLAGTTGYFGYKRFEGSGCRGLAGEIRWAGIYDGHCLTPGQHDTLFNALAQELGKTQVSGAAPVPEPTCELDPAKPGWQEGFVLSKTQPPMHVEQLVRDGQPYLRFNGEASAGVGLDLNRPVEGDGVDFEFTFQLEQPLEPEDEVVLCTTGGGDHPLRVVVNGSQPDRVQLRLDGLLTPVGQLGSSGDARLFLRIDAATCSVSVSGQPPVPMPFITASTWLYLGQGYLEDRVCANLAFTVEQCSIRSRVTRK